MFENYDLAERHEDLVLTPAQRKAVTFLATLNISVIWMYFFFADRPGATGMTERSILQQSLPIGFPALSVVFPFSQAVKRPLSFGKFLALATSQETQLGLTWS